LTTILNSDQALRKPPRLSSAEKGYDWREFDKWLQQVYQLLGAFQDGQKAVNLFTGKINSDTDIDALTTESLFAGTSNDFPKDLEDVRTQALMQDTTRDYSGALADIQTQLMMGDTINPTWETRIRALENLPKAIDIGGIYATVTVYTASSLAIALGYGTWVAWGTGKIPMGVDPADSDIDTAEKTAGEKTHTLTAGEMPVHTHTQDAHHHMLDQASVNGGSGNLSYPSTASGGSLYTDNYQTKDTTATNQNAGSGGAHNNLPPVIAVFLWKRTA
jgi:hypothetical protein